jgi:hypothetical protein
VATLIWGFIFGCIGLGYVSYGKSQHAIKPMLCGVAMMVFPYFVSGVLLTVLVGVLLMAIPWFWRE